MTTIYAIHAPEGAKLMQVIAEMKVMGAPTIQVVDCGDHYMALEGSHRLAAAHALGLTPVLMIHDQAETRANVINRIASLQASFASP